MMKLATFLVYAITCAVDPFLWMCGFSTLLQKKNKNKYYYILAFLGLYSIMALRQTLLEHIPNFGIFFFPIVFLYVLSVSKLIFYGKLKEMIKIFVSIYILSVVTDCIFSIIFMQMGIEDITSTTKLFNGVITLFVRFANIFLFLVVGYFLKRYKKISLTNMETTWNICTVTTLTILFLASYALAAFDNSKELENIIYGVQITVFLIFVFFMTSLLKAKTIDTYKERNKAILAESKVEWINYSKQTTQELRELRHDLKNHFNILLTLLLKNKVQEAIDYLSKFSNDIDKTKHLYNMDNTVLSIVLTNKSKEATKSGITFIPTITTQDFPFNEAELTSVLCNILDNAIEANLYVDMSMRSINFSVKRINNILQIHCINPYEVKNLQRTGLTSFISTKNDNKYHGYGTKILRKIIKQYNGELKYWIDGNLFHTDIMIIIKGKNKEV